MINLTTNKKWNPMLITEKDWTLEEYKDMKRLYNVRHANVVMKNSSIYDYDRGQDQDKNMEKFIHRVHTRFRGSNIQGEHTMFATQATQHKH